MEYLPAECYTPTSLVFPHEWFEKATVSCLTLVPITRHVLGSDYTSRGIIGGLFITSGV